MPRTKRENAQDGIANDVAAFPDVEVPLMKVLRIHAEKKMQQWIKNSAGVSGGKQCRRLNGDDNEPKNGGDPCLQQIMAVRVQTGEPSAGRAGPDSRERLFPHKRNLDERALFDGIVGSLAGNHDIVNVALAQSGAADADEARFLQQLRDRGAAAVSHA